MTINVNHIEDYWDTNTPDMPNMSNMFRNCHSLVGFGDLDWSFEVNGTIYKFTEDEIYRLKKAVPDFTFEDKDIPQLRKITNHFIKTFHPEDLL